MNYQIIKHQSDLEGFVWGWLPKLEKGEVFYVALFARKKYCPEVLSSDKAQLKRFTSTKENLVDKIRQLECPVGAYTFTRGNGERVAVPQEALALYITPNPRSLEKATRTSLIRFANLMGQEYNGYNPHQECMSEIQKSKSRTVWVDFDFDVSWDVEGKLMEIPSIVNPASLTLVRTRGGFHALVRPQLAGLTGVTNWYNRITSLPGVDVRGDCLLPVPGCVQGDFVPYLMEL